MEVSQTYDASAEKPTGVWMRFRDVVDLEREIGTVRVASTRRGRALEKILWTRVDMNYRVSPLGTQSLDMRRTLLFERIQKQICR